MFQDFLITDNCALLVRRYHLQVDILPVPDPFLQIVVAGDVTQCSVDSFCKVGGKYVTIFFRLVNKKR